MQTYSQVDPAHTANRKSKTPIYAPFIAVEDKYF
jgi:hypothetical protein